MKQTPPHGQQPRLCYYGSLAPFPPHAPRMHPLWPRIACRRGGGVEVTSSPVPVYVVLDTIPSRYFPVQKGSTPLICVTLEYCRIRLPICHLVTLPPSCLVMPVCAHHGGRGWGRSVHRSCHDHGSGVYGSSDSQASRVQALPGAPTARRARTVRSSSDGGRRRAGLPRRSAVDERSGR